MQLAAACVQLSQSNAGFSRKSGALLVSLKISLKKHVSTWLAYVVCCPSWAAMLLIRWDLAFALVPGSIQELGGLYSRLSLQAAVQA